MKLVHVKLLPNERWWGGASDLGTEMPFRKGSNYDLLGNTFGNQGSPFLLSSVGRFVWSKDPFHFRFTADELILEGTGPFIVARGGDNLRGALRTASNRFFPPSGSLPHPLLFTAPQYNTWIELMYQQAEKPILDYAAKLLQAGFPPGVLMIDEGWFSHLGAWDFDPVRFPDPKGMIRQLHHMGFKVMLWIIPYISPDGAVFRSLRSGSVLVKGVDGHPVVRPWWNGYSALVDVTGGEGRDWFLGQVERLRKKYGVDGFKFDGGDSGIYSAKDVVAKRTHPNGHTEAFAKLGLNYRLNEYRACWKCAGQPLVQRLRDKLHSWGKEGLASLIPCTLAQGLMGYSFVCPDMIGGGEYVNFMANSDRLDPELFVRYAQASALMPMMQFSAAPWRVLDNRHLRLCVEAAALHSKFGRIILALARQSARTGEPIARHLAYEFPGHGYEDIDDQFLLGPNILVAPTLQKGAKKRLVHIPPGRWTADDGARYTGPTTVMVNTPLERLPHFKIRRVH